MSSSNYKDRIAVGPKSWQERGEKGSLLSKNVHKLAKLSPKNPSEKRRNEVQLEEFFKPALIEFR